MLAVSGKENAYEILGITANATSDDLKRAYRKKILLAHPDKGGSSEDFQKIQTAYDVLKDVVGVRPGKRQAPDGTAPAFKRANVDKDTPVRRKSTMAEEIYGVFSRFSAQARPKKTQTKTKTANSKAKVTPAPPKSPSDADKLTESQLEDLRIRMAQVDKGGRKALLAHMHKHHVKQLEQFMQSFIQKDDSEQKKPKAAGDNSLFDPIVEPGPPTSPNSDSSEESSSSDAPNAKSPVEQVKSPAEGTPIAAPTLRPQRPLPPRGTPVIPGGIAANMLPRWECQRPGGFFRPRARHGPSPQRHATPSPQRYGHATYGPHLQPPYQYPRQYTHGPRPYAQPRHPAFASYPSNQGPRYPAYPSEHPPQAYPRSPIRNEGYQYQDFQQMPFQAPPTHCVPRGHWDAYGGQPWQAPPMQPHEPQMEHLHQPHDRPQAPMHRPHDRASPPMHHPHDRAPPMEHLPYPHDRASPPLEHVHYPRDTAPPPMENLRYPHDTAPPPMENLHYPHERAPPPMDNLHYPHDRAPPPMEHARYPHDRAPPPMDHVHYPTDRAPPAEHAHYPHDIVPPVEHLHYPHDRAPPMGHPDLQHYPHNPQVRASPMENPSLHPPQGTAPPIAQPTQVARPPRTPQVDTHPYPDVPTPAQQTSTTAQPVEPPLIRVVPSPEPEPRPKPEPRVEKPALSTADPQSDDDLKKLQERLTSLCKQDRINAINELQPVVRQRLNEWVSSQKEKALERRQAEQANGQAGLSPEEILEKGRSLREKLLALPRRERKAAFAEMSEDEIQAVRSFVQKAKREDINLD